MKRAMSADNGPSFSRKRYRPEDMTIRLLISSKTAGGIIGKGGSNIKGLREKYNANLSVPDTPGPERVVNIGADLDVALSIVEDLLPLMDDGGESRGGGRAEDEGHEEGDGGGEASGGGGAEGSGHSSWKKSEAELRLLVPTMQVGCIIGRSGFKIQELRLNTGAQLRVFTELCPKSTDRVTMISGDRDKVMNCLRTVMKLLEENPPKGMVTPYDPVCYDEAFASEYGGFNDTRYGFQGRPGRNFSGPGYGSSGPRGGHGAYGGPPPYSRGGAPPRRGGFGGMQRGRGAIRPDFRGGMDGPPMDNFRSPRHMERDEVQTQHFSIQKSVAGAIIGMGGSRIRQIRAESGAQISIDDAKEGQPERIITIHGTCDQVDLARVLLQKSVRENGGVSGYE